MIQQCVYSKRIISAMTSFPAFAFLLSVLASSANGRVLTDLVTTCKASDPNLNACVKDAANALMPKMTQGFEEYDIPVLDPLFTPMLDLVEETKYVKIDLKYIDAHQKGLSKMVVNSADINLDKGEWLFDLTQPYFEIKGKYQSKGTVLDVAVDGEGTFNTTHEDTGLKVAIHVSKVNKDGEDYFKLEKFTIDYTFGKATMFFSHLFDGDADMEKSTNDFLNEHAHEILTDLKPALEQVYADLFKGYLESLLNHAPVSMLFPN